VAEQLLDDPQIGATLEQMSGGAVSQPVRPQVRRIRHMSEQSMHNSADLPRIYAAATTT